MDENTVKFKGSVEKIVYTNADNNFTVARFKAKDREESLTIVGNLTAVSAGEMLDITGIWQESKFGPQFKVSSYSFIVPTTKEAIEKYLGSGLIKGVGPATAKRMVAKFGEDTLNIIENDLGKLKQISGIGSRKLKDISAAWQQQKEIKNIMLFLQGHGVSTAYSVRIYKEYENKTIAVLKENPYRLAQDIRGIGFKIADTIAMKMGIASDAPIRLEAGLLYVLNDKRESEGHTFFPKDQLLDICLVNIGGEREALANALSGLELKKLVVCDEQGDDENIYLIDYFLAEKNIARRLKVFLSEDSEFEKNKVIEVLKNLQNKSKISLADNQKRALLDVFLSKIKVITGGPGTGKTTIIKFIVDVASAMDKKIRLAAPTGRAAKQLFMASGYDAVTLHRLLEFNPAFRKFERDEFNPLELDILVVDESSMIDVLMMNSLIKALPSHAHLILVGDIDQLPSVGAGNVLRDIIESGICRATKLDVIFRQGQESFIVANAHKINSGTLPDIQQGKDKLSDFYFIDKKNPQEILDTVVELVSKRIPKRFKFNPFDDIQVLSPMHKGDIGVSNLNEVLMHKLNPGRSRTVKGFSVNDKIMQVKNNYDKDVFNGDIGRVISVDTEEEELLVDYYGRKVTYEKHETDEIVPAFAVSVHKSQGSEYPCVIVVLSTQHFVLLQRNMLYTAVTRGKKLVVVVGSFEALKIAVGNDKINKRYSNLKNFLKES